MLVDAITKKIPITSENCKKQIKAAADSLVEAGKSFYEKTLADIMGAIKAAEARFKQLVSE